MTSDERWWDHFSEITAEEYEAIFAVNANSESGIYRGTPKSLPERKRPERMTSEKCMAKPEVTK